MDAPDRDTAQIVNELFLVDSWKKGEDIDTFTSQTSGDCHFYFNGRYGAFEDANNFSDVPRVTMHENVVVSFR